ncbi:MAG: hypothetical protein ACI83B_003051 [Sediminicola sp.]|jgi:hypothetical protein
MVHRLSLNQILILFTVFSMPSSMIEIQLTELFLLILYIKTLGDKGTQPIPKQLFKFNLS